MNKKIAIVFLSLLFVVVIIQLWSVETTYGETTVIFDQGQELKAGEDFMINNHVSGKSAAIEATASITLTEVISSSAGLERPTDIANAGDGRLFIVEKAGRIRVFDGTTVLPAPFLDITELVSSGDSDGQESGLLGLVFHPDYPANGYFYVNYTHQTAGAGLVTRVSRYQVSAGDPNIADPAGTVILEFAQDQANHNGGDLNFGPNDGYLYIAVGDGGRQGDPLNRAQTNTQLLGKILRIDVDASGGADCDQSGSSNYDSPTSNPMIDGPGGNCDEIWANGLRNPWRFSFDRDNGDMWIADVGFQNWEEVDYQPAGSNGGENWGWRCYEGNNAFDTSLCGPMSGYEFPVLAYSHGGDPFRCSITGGFVYRGTAVPELEGHYLFTDYCSGEFWSLKGNDITTLTDFGLPDVPGASFSNPTTFGEGANGELYVAENGIGASIFKVTGTTLPCVLCFESRLPAIFG